MSRENHIYEPDWSGRTDQLCSVNKPVKKRCDSTGDWKAGIYR